MLTRRWDVAWRMAVVIGVAALIIWTALIHVPVRARTWGEYCADARARLDQAEARIARGDESAEMIRQREEAQEYIARSCRPYQLPVPIPPNMR